MVDQHRSELVFALLRIWVGIKEGQPGQHLLSLDRKIIIGDGLLVPMGTLLTPIVICPIETWQQFVQPPKDKPCLSLLSILIRMTTRVKCQYVLSNNVNIFPWRPLMLQYFQAVHRDRDHRSSSIHLLYFQVSIPPHGSGCRSQ